MQRMEIHFNKSEAAAVAKLWHKEGESFSPFKAGPDSAIADAHNTRTPVVQFLASRIYE